MNHTTRLNGMAQAFFFFFFLWALLAKSCFLLTNNLK